MRPFVAMMAISVSSVLLGGCSRSDDVVAEVVGERITTKEFGARYALYLKETGVRDNILARQQVLNNMINERLIYDDMRRQGLDRDPRFLRRIEEIRLQAIVDGFARRVTTDTLRVSEAELQEEFRSFLTKASARYLYAPTEEEAGALKKRLERGERFEDLAREVFEDPGLATNGGYLGVFGWGELEPGLEDAAFRVPLGTVSKPVRIRIGWAVVKPETRVMQPLASEQDYARVRPKLEQVVRGKKTQRLTDAVLRAAEADLAPSFDDDAVNEVFAAWGTLIAPAGPMGESAAPAAPVLHDRFLATLGGRAWTVGEFVERLDRTTGRQRRRVTSPAHVKEMAIGLALRDVMVERALRDGLPADPAVRAQIQKVSDEFRLEFWASTVQDTVRRHRWDESALRRQYNAGGDRYRVPPLVNVAEILLNTEAEAREAAALVRRGADFSRVARERSLRLWAARLGGELGYGTRSTYGPLGEKFLAAPVGAIIGPERVDPYYGVFRVLGKMEGRVKSFEEVRAEIVQEGATASRKDALRRAVDALRGRVPITVHHQALENVALS